MLSVTLRQLEYAVAVHRHGGVTAAATVLNVSQPALSVALAQLEGQIGKSLFLRKSGGPITPTSFGRDFLATAKVLLDDANRLIEDRSRPTRGPVILGIFEDLAPLLLAPILAALRKTHPDIDIELYVGGFEALSTALRSTGQADIAITYDLGLDRAFTRHELARLPLQAVVHAEHPFAIHGSTTMAEVAAQPIILTNQGLSRSHMLKVVGDRGFTLHVAYSAGAMETMRSFAANDLGVGLSYTRPKPQISYDGQAVRHIPIVDAEVSEPIVLVHHGVGTLSTAAMAIRDAITEMKLDL
jgi:DNA-binding transcriptional LysR family regulator